MIRTVEPHSVLINMLEIRFAQPAVRLRYELVCKAACGRDSGKGVYWLTTSDELLVKMTNTMNDTSEDIGLAIKVLKIGKRQALCRAYGKSDDAKRVFAPHEFTLTLKRPHELHFAVERTSRLVTTEGRYTA